MNLARTAELLLAHALSLPSAWEDHPWGERVAKVGPKIFLFFGRDSTRGDALLLSVKLPTSSITALDRPECEPSGYGMGRHNWVTAKYERGDTLPVDLLKSWIDESYRAVAPKKLAKVLDGATTPAPERRAKSATTRAATTRAATTRAATTRAATTRAATTRAATTRAAKPKSPSAAKRKVAKASPKSRAR